MLHVFARVKTCNHQSCYSASQDTRKNASIVFLSQQDGNYYHAIMIEAVADSPDS